MICTNQGDSCKCTNCRLKKLEAVVFKDTHPAQPTERIPTLVEVCSGLICDAKPSDNNSVIISGHAYNSMLRATAAEKKRQDEIVRLITHLKSEGHDGKLNSQNRKCPICQIINTLDAFEKESGV